MSFSSNPKVSKPLARPSSGQQKRTSTATTSSKMEILPPEESKTATNFSKPLLSVKKEIKLERTGSAASKKSNTSVMSSTEVSGFDYTPDRDIMSQSSRSKIDTTQAEDLRKISSKPFSTKSKQQKKQTSIVAESNELTKSTQSTNIDASQPHLYTPGTEPNVTTSQALLSNVGDDDNLFGSAQQRLDFTPGNVDDLLMYDDLGEDNKEEENIEIDINFAELHKKFEEMASRQKEIEMIAKDYVNHILNARTETGEALVQFPTNFQEIVDNTVEETKTMEELRDKGIVSDAGIQRFIQEQVRTSLNQAQKQKKEEEEEDPYAMEKEKIREYDRILAQKEREIRIKKDTEKMKRMQELQEFDEEEMSMDNIDKVFLTAWHKKKKSAVTSAQVSAHKEKRKQEEDKVITSKPKIFAGKNHIKKNIQGAFVKAKESLIAKLSEKDQQRLESFMSVINRMIDHEGSEDDLLKQIVPNPYDLGEGDAYRMQEIDQRMALLSLDQNVKKLEDPVDQSKLPKDKALRDQAEKRALQEKNDAVTRKLMDINNKDRLNEKCDPETITALVEQLKKEHAALGIDSTRKKTGEEDDELERQFKDAVTAVSGYDTEEILQDLDSLSKQTQSVQKKLKSVMNNINGGASSIEEKKEKNKSELLDMYSARKNALSKLENDTVQNDLDNLLKLEKKLFQAEKSAIDAENRLRSELDIANPIINYEPEKEKTAEDYDREFTEKLRLQNPELFKDIPEGEDDVEIDVKYKDVIIEEWHDDENDENQEPH